MKKRLFGAALIFCMVLVLLPVIPVMHADASSAQLLSGTTVKGTYSTIGDAIEAAADGDTIKLIDNVTVSFQVTIAKELTLDLNGYTLKYESENSGRVIWVNRGANFTLKDSSAAKTGKITGGWGSNGGGGVLNNGTFTMEGGTISDCSVDSFCHGGGVHSEGTFVMKGGTISNCTAGMGGGVFNKGTFTMEGGTISDCTALSNYNASGGVYNGDDLSGVTFNMKGGVISGCDVYNYKTSLKNDSATGATIVYGQLRNKHTTITGCLVRFMDGGNMYANEVVRDNSTLIKPMTLSARAGRLWAGIRKAR